MPIWLLRRSGCNWLKFSCTVPWAVYFGGLEEHVRSHYFVALLLRPKTRCLLGAKRRPPSKWTLGSMPSQNRHSCGMISQKQSGALQGSNWRCQTPPHSPTEQRYHYPHFLLHFNRATLNSSNQGLLCWLQRRNVPITCYFSFPFLWGSFLWFVVRLSRICILLMLSQSKIATVCPWRAKRGFGRGVRGQSQAFRSNYLRWR